MDVERIWDRQQQRLYAEADRQWHESYDLEVAMKSVDADDLLNQLYDVRGTLLALAKTGQTETIGRIVVSVLNDYAETLARRGAGEDACSNPSQAALDALASLTAAIARDDRAQRRAEVEALPEALL